MGAAALDADGGTLAGVGCRFPDDTCAELFSEPLLRVGAGDGLEAGIIAGDASCLESGAPPVPGVVDFEGLGWGWDISSATTEGLAVVRGTSDPQVNISAP